MKERADAQRVRLGEEERLHVVVGDPARRRRAPVARGGIGFFFFGMFAQPARLAFPPAPRGDPPPHLLARRPPTRAETRARPRWHRRAEPRGPAAATVRRRGFVPFGNASRDRKVFFFGRKRKARAPRRKGSRVARARRDGLGGVRAFVVRLRVTGVTSHERGFVLVPLVVVVEAGGHARDPVLAIARRPRRAHHDALQVAERPAPPPRARLRLVHVHRVPHRDVVQGVLVERVAVEGVRVRIVHARGSRRLLGRLHGARSGRARPRRRFPECEKRPWGGATGAAPRGPRGGVASTRARVAPRGRRRGTARRRRPRARRPSSRAHRSGARSTTADEEKS